MHAEIGSFIPAESTIAIEVTGVSLVMGKDFRMVYAIPAILFPLYGHSCGYCPVLFSPCPQAKTPHPAAPRRPGNKGQIQK